MFIKKVMVDWPGGNRYPSLRILFYDQDGKLFESGSTISSTGKKAETDNFIVTVTPEGADDASRYPINAISTEVYKDINDASLSYFRGRETHNDDFIIEFKTIQPISKIKVCIKITPDSSPYATLRVIDINDNEENYNIGDNNIGKIYEYDLKTQTYNINKVGIVETTIDTNTVHFLQFKI